MTKTNQKHPKVGLKINSKNTSHIERVKTELITLETIEKPFKGISVTRTMRIIKEEKCPKLSPRALGGLVYNIGYTEDEQAFHFRITANSSSGYFSKEWVALKAIQEVLDQQKKDSPFKAITLKGLYKKRGANNHGFLAAALRAEMILGVVEKQPLLHTLNVFEAFATVKSRTKRTRNCGSIDTTLVIIYKLIESAQRRWKRIEGGALLTLVVNKVKFINGLQVKCQSESAAA